MPRDAVEVIWYTSYGSLPTQGDEADACLTWRPTILRQGSNIMVAATPNLAAWVYEPGS